MDNLNLVLGIIGDQLECGLRQWVDPPALLRLELDNLFYVWLFDHGYPSLLKALQLFKSFLLEEPKKQKCDAQDNCKIRQPRTYPFDHDKIGGEFRYVCSDSSID